MSVFSSLSRDLVISSDESEPEQVSFISVFKSFSLKWKIARKITTSMFKLLFFFFSFFLFFLDSPYTGF